MDWKFIYDEDDLGRNQVYQLGLPRDLVRCHLKIKDDLILAGLPWFCEAFNFLSPSLFSQNWNAEKEGKKLAKGEELIFELPFHIALTGERIALNLLSRASAIATYTHRFVEKAEKYSIRILDTRKTTPGLRSLEKYAVVQGGGYNHRLGPTDLFMVKDNHKKFFGGVQNAVEFFRSQNGFYTPILVEIHHLEELSLCRELKVKHIMLDNFSPSEIKKALSLKTPEMTYEVSGGIDLNNLDDYLLEGVDALSIGRLTYGAPPVDLSLKISKP